MTSVVIRWWRMQQRTQRGTVHTLCVLYRCLCAHRYKPVHIGNANRRYSSWLHTLMNLQYDYAGKNFMKIERWRDEDEAVVLSRTTTIVIKLFFRLVFNSNSSKFSPYINAISKNSNKRERYFNYSCAWSIWWFYHYIHFKYRAYQPLVSATYRYSDVDSQVLSSMTFLDLFTTSSAFRIWSMRNTIS